MSFPAHTHTHARSAAHTVAHADSGDVVHSIEVLHPESPERNTERRPVVLLHGYGAALGIFWRNLDALSRHDELRVFAVDWLGMVRAWSPRSAFDIASGGALTLAAAGPLFAP